MARPTPAQISDMDKQTNDIGLFNFAEAYLLCGKTLTSQKINGLTFAHPIEYLFYHAIELYLKSYLRNRGLGAYKLAKDYSHNLVKLRDKAATFGLLLDQQESLRLEHLQDQNLVIEARYIRTGLKHPLRLEALRGAAERIRDKVQHELIQAGVQLRPGTFFPDITFDTSYRNFPQVSDDV